jgi:hypothetical protein
MPLEGFAASPRSKAKAQPSRCEPRGMPWQGFDAIHDEPSEQKANEGELGCR